MTYKGNILAVDDTPASLMLLTEILSDEGYDVSSAISGELALQVAAIEPPDLVLLDICMPEMDGFEVCRRLKNQLATRHVPIIFVSAISETREKVLGFELGAVDFVSKPYQRDELLARVHTHLELNYLRNHLKKLVEERTSELRKSEIALNSNLLDSISSLASLVEMRDPYTAGHQRRVAQLAASIARELKLSEDQIEGIRLAAIVHDVGKNNVPIDYLSKPGRLTTLEYSIIKEHAQNGYEVLKTINFPWPIAQIVLQHHERSDGSGYPLGLKGNEILLEARILSVADVVEAMASHRPYRQALGVKAALEEINRGSGSCYDPIVVEACLKLFLEQNYTFEIFL